MGNPLLFFAFLMSFALDAPFALAKGRCVERTLQYTLFEPSRIHPYTVYVDRSAKTSASRVAVQLQERGFQVDLIDEVNGKLVVRSADPSVAAIREIPGIREIAVRYRVLLSPDAASRTPETFQRWKKALVDRGAVYVRDDATHGLESFLKSGEIVFLSNVERMNEVTRILPKESTWGAFPPTRRVASELFAPRTPEAELLKGPLTHGLGQAWEELRTFFTVETSDQASFDRLVGKLTELDGVEVQILTPTRGNHRVQVTAPEARIRELKRALKMR